MVEVLRFPDIPLYEGWGAPNRVESTVRDIEVVQGEIPAGLNGTWYRCGPDRQYPSLYKDDVFIDGEGMAHMFRFEDGRCDYISRWVRNERFLLQEKARRSLFGRYRNRHTNDPSVAGASMGTSNTNLVWHAGKLLVMKEDDLPYEMDPDTLETVGRYDYAGSVDATSMTAHPKVDWVTNEMFTYSYQAEGDASTAIRFYVIGPDGRIRHEVRFDMPWAACVHDFAITENYAVFPFFPLITDAEVIRQGGPYFQYHPDKETLIAVVPKYGKAEDIRWFRGANTTAGHMMNAYEEGSKIHLDLCLYDGNCFPFFQTPAGETTAPVPPVLTRLSMDLESNTGEFGRGVLMPQPCEMPRTDDRMQGRPYRYGFFINYAGPPGTSSLGRIDHATGERKIWSPGPACLVQEPQFVPRSPDAPEGDGWVLTLVSRTAEGRSDLAVLDATDIEAGPVALLKLPVRVRSTFHGTWAPADARGDGLYHMARPA